MTLHSEHVPWEASPPRVCTRVASKRRQDTIIQLHRCHYRLSSSELIIGKIDSLVWELWRAGCSWLRLDQI